MEWLSGIGIIVLIVVAGAGLFYGIWWIARREARASEQGKELHETGPSAEEVVDAAVKRGLSVPRLMVAVALVAIVVMGILSRMQG